MTVAVETSRKTRYLRINIEHGCTVTPECARLARSEYDGTFYTQPAHPLSVVVFPDTGTEYERHMVSRVTAYNARAARRNGYWYERIDRADWADDLHAIRSSTDFRQGRKMPAAYMQPERYGSDKPTGPVCDRHQIIVHGVIGPDGHLAAYCQLVQCGEVVRFNTILGHWDKLKHSVMWLLCLEALKWHIDQCRARYGLYYTHESGHGDGLRYFKERFGMLPSRVTWL